MMFTSIRAMARGLRPGVILPRDNLKTDITNLVRTLSLTAVKLSEQKNYCSIKKLEVNQKISQMVLDGKDSLDMSVIHILKKDIQVLELPLMMNRKLNSANLTHNQKKTKHS